MAEVMRTGAGGAGAARLGLATQGHAPLCCRSQHKTQSFHGAGVLQAHRHPRPGSGAQPHLPGYGRVPEYGSCSPLPPLLLPLLGTAVVWQTQLWTQGSAGTGSATFLLSPQRQALSLPGSRSSVLSSPFPSSQGLPGLPLLLLQTAPEAGAAAGGV